MFSRFPFTAAVLATAITLSGQLFTSSSATAAPAVQGQVHFGADHLYPESVSWSAKQKVFFVGSVRHGTIGKVSPDGKYVPFITDDKLVSSLGILVDDARNTLWVAIADPGVGDRTNPSTQGKLAAVAAYDATTGERRAYYDLGSLNPGAHFANDVALDKAGNVYVSDSFAPNIYRIGTDGQTSIFAQNPVLKDGDGFNLNGIAWHSGGYLLVGKYNSGEIFRIPVSDPTRIEKVALSKPIKGADGFHLVDSEHLIVAQNLGTDTVVELVSTDGWKSARVAQRQKSGMSMPSAATQVGKNIYVLDSRIDNLFDPKATKVDDFQLERF